MAETQAKQKLTAVFCTDVAGYSRLMGDDPEATLSTLTAYREVFFEEIGRSGGRVVNAPGDSILAEFPSVIEAVRSAVAIQRELGERNGKLPENRRMDFRVGVNLGDVLIKDGELFGDGVNIAARLESLAEPGGICVSRSVHDQVKQRLELDYEYLGEKTVKNIAEPVRAYRIVFGRQRPGVAHSRPDSTGWRGRRKNLLMLVAAAWLGLGGLVGLYFFAAPFFAGQGSDSAMGGALPIPDKPSIAVLPFINMSGDPDQEYFSDGITEDIITDLSQVKGLFVIARNSTFTYKGRAVKAQQVSRELGVKYLLEGSVRKAGKRLRINAQLIDATTGNHLWAERYDRSIEDIFAVQDEISRKIVAALEVKLIDRRGGRHRQNPPQNLAAYDLFLRGLQLKARYSPESNLKAREKFSQAIELEPNYAVAYLEMGYTYFLDWALQWNTDPAGLEKVHELARKCIELDPGVSGCHALMSNYLLWKKRHDQAIEAARKAVALNPNDAESRSALAEVLVFAGRPEEGLAEIQRAMRQDPHYPFFFLWTRAHAYFLLREYDDAIVAFERVLTRNPNFMPANIYLAVLYTELGNAELAQNYAAKIREVKDRKAYLHKNEPIIPYKRVADLERLRNGFKKMKREF